MTWLRKTRSVLIALVLVVVIGSIIGARELTHGGSNAAATSSDAGPKAAGGPVVMGTVDTDPGPVNYGLPPVLPSGTIAEVFVKEGDEVKAGQELYKFDDAIQKKTVNKAEAAVTYAETKVKQAEELAKQHAKRVEVAESGVALAKRKEALTADYHKLVDLNLNSLYKEFPENTWAERKQSDPNLYKAHVDYDTAVGERKLAEANRDLLKAADPQVQVKEAQAAVEQAKVELATAQSIMGMCVVRAKVPGTIEQISISPGTTLGISTRTPALWLVPAGPRVVRAEVEAEFAHRVGADLKGKTVTITDHTDSKLTYSGVVRRVPRIFMLKRGNAENLLGGDTRVLEVVIEVSDPAPAGKPPLAIGQRVRVNLGQ